MQYIIYETTNLVNGKKYIGKHVTDNLNDGYLGSGKLLLKAIKKYGKNSFEKKILCFCENESQMNKKESELVTLSICKNPQYYNLVFGGNGGVTVLDKKHIPDMNATSEVTPSSY